MPIQPNTVLKFAKSPQRLPDCLPKCVRAPGKTWPSRPAPLREVVPNFNPRLARTFAALAQATYCDDVHDEIRNWTCGPCRHSGLNVVPGSVRFIKHNEVWQANSTFIVVARVAEKSESEDALGCIGAFRGNLSRLIVNLKPQPLRFILQLSSFFFVQLFANESSACSPAN